MKQVEATLTLPGKIKLSQASSGMPSKKSRKNFLEMVATCAGGQQAKERLKYRLATRRRRSAHWIMLEAIQQ